MNNSRENGFYWVRIKERPVLPELTLPSKWVVLEWLDYCSQGPGWTTDQWEDEEFVEIDERRLERVAP